MADQKISDLSAAGALTGTELVEAVQGGANVQTTTQDIADLSGVTREFDRAWSAELLFDKNEIEGELHTQVAAIEFTVAASGNLSGETSTYGQRITTDGVNGISFTGFSHISNIAQGEVLEAGTYQFIFWYSNGIARATVMLPSEEAANLVPLSAPANFAAVADGETEIDLSWDTVTNVSSYEIYISTAGGSGPWTLLTSPGSGDTTYSTTGLSAGSTYHFRIRAIGDQTTFGNSLYSTDAATTEDSGDATAPTFIFEPADAATGIAVNHPITITASEALIDDDGVTVIDNSNVANYIVLKEDNGAGANIPFTATIDAGKTVIVVTPNVVYPSLDNVFVQIDGVEDVNGNESTADDATFATSDYTEMDGNYLSLGTQIDSVIVGADKNFELEAEYQEFLQVSGVRGLFQKYLTTGAGNKSFVASTQGDGEDVVFTFLNTTSFVRKIIWVGALTGFTAGKITFKYFGAIDTNDGLDRIELYIDDVLITAGKSIIDTAGAWPFDIAANSQPFYLNGPTFREVRNFKVRNNMGATTIVDIPVIRTGTDVSGNSFDGTWI